MSQHVLYGFEVGSSSYEVSCKRMSEGMWADLLFYSGFGRGIPDDIKDHDPADLASSPIQEYMVLIAFLDIHHRSSNSFNVQLKLFESIFSNWNEPFFIIFSEHFDKLMFKEDI